MDASVMEGAENEWELSKENVQPLRQGRKFANLAAALQPHTADQMVKLKEQRQIFETELRSYNGDDPLSVWHRYIQWTEQNFPKGGKDANLQQLIENCITTFKDDERYKNDTRLIDIWIKFTSYCTDPLEIYSFLFNQGIGCGLSRFYHTWAAELEKLGSTKKADLIYLRGIENGAQPLDLLKRQHREFQARVARGVAGHMTDDVAMPTAEHESTEPQRSALGQLKAKGKKAAAPANRTAIPLRHGGAGGLAPDHPASGPNGRNTFAVFADENVAPTAIPAQTKAWQSVPGRDRENEQDPGRWTGARVKQKHQPVVPVSELSSHSKQQDFAVHQDQTPDTPVTMPRRVPQDDQVLSARKVEKEADPFHALQRQPGQAGSSAPSGVSMYDRHKVYAGVNEFSFEEIHAADWMKRQRRREEKRLEDERRREQEVRHEQLQQTVQEQQRMIEHLKQNQEMMASMMAASRNRPAEREVPQSVNTSSQNTSVRGGNISLGHLSSSASFSAETSLRNDGLFRMPTRIDRTTSSGRLQVPVARDGGSAETSALSSSTHVSADSSLESNTSLRGHGRNTSRCGWLSAPSPTVNTKEAMMEVRNMFNVTLSSAAQARQFESSYSLNKGDEVSTHLPATSGRPITVFEESCITEPGVRSMQPPVVSAMPIMVFEESRMDEPELEAEYGQDVEVESDKENLIPSGCEMPPPKRVGLKAILQPAEGMTVDEEPHLERFVDEEDEAMDGIEVMGCNFADMTFAPTSCSTQNFTATARLASTPFNGLGAMAPLPAPPLSTIKPGTVNASGPGLHHQSECTLSTDMTSGVGFSDNRRSECFGTSIRQENNLSIILEGSNEGKSHSSASSAGSTTCGGTTTVEWSHHNNTTKADHSKKEFGTTTAEWSRHNNTTTAEQSKKEFAAPQFDSDEFAPKFDPMLDCTKHNIDTTNYVPGDITMAGDPFEMSIAINPDDPFDEELIDEFLLRLPVPIETHPNFVKMPLRIPKIAVGMINILAGQAYQVDCLLGEGSYAKVYKAIMFDEDNTGEGDRKVLKVQKPGCLWEFYMVTELQQRLADLNADINVCPSVMSIDQGYFYKDGSCLVSDLQEHGTLLALINAGKKLGKSKPQSEMMSICFVIEILHIVEQMHRCNIIHGDIKPDNFLLRPLRPLAETGGPAELLSGHTRALQLIDFGRSIDMNMFQPGTTFMVKVETDSFQCIEMKTDRPWTYQTDMFGVIGTIYVLLFGRYMQVYPEAGHWKTTNTFKRYWVVGDLWQSLFDSLLNIPSCDNLPDLVSIRQSFEKAFLDNVVWADFCAEIKELDAMLQSN